MSVRRILVGIHKRQSWRNPSARAIAAFMVFERHKSYWQNIKPAGAVGDFVAVFRAAGRYRWRIALASLGCTATVFSLIVWEEARILPKPPEVTYINSWRPDRSDAEIHAGNLVNEQKKEREAAEQAERDEKVRHIYKVIGRASGMDVDAIEAKAKAEDAASAKAASAASAAPAVAPKQPAP